MTSVARSAAAAAAIAAVTLGSWSAANTARLRRRSATATVGDAGGRRFRHDRAPAGAARAVLVMDADLGFGSVYWHGVVAALARDFDVVTYDRAGYGGSRAAPRTRSVLATSSDDLLRLVDEVRGSDGASTPTIVVGAGYGGRNALVAASRHRAIAAVFAFEPVAAAAQAADPGRAREEERLDQEIPLTAVTLSLGLGALKSPVPMGGLDDAIAAHLRAANADARTWRTMWRERRAVRGTDVPLPVITDRPTRICLDSSTAQRAPDVYRLWADAVEGRPSADIVVRPIGDRSRLVVSPPSSSALAHEIGIFAAEVSSTRR